MKPDERALLLTALTDRPSLYSAPEMNHKRRAYILRKWTERGWWEYGVSLRTGWLTPEGTAKAEVLQNVATSV